MRRTLKSITWALVAFGVLVALALPLTLAPVDLTAYLRSPYATATRNRLAAITSAPARPAPVRAGFGRASLTPIVTATSPRPERGEFSHLPLAGYGGRQGRPATGTHDPLWARAIALEAGGRTAVFVASETLILPREVAEEVERRLAATAHLPTGSIYFGATHAHSSFGGWGEGPVAKQFAGDFTPGLREWFAAQLAAAATDALADLAPASVGHDSVAAPDLVRNRLVGELGTTDPELSFLLVRRADGSSAVLGAFAAHATVLSDDVMQFSGDYPGAWSRALESSGVTVAAFFAGGVGSHSPVPPQRGFEGAAALGQTLASRLITRLPEVQLTNQVALACLNLPVDLPETQWRVADGVRLRSWATHRLMPKRPDATWLRAVRVGDALWVGTPCDFSGELARPIKAELQRRGLHATITSFNGDYIGYVIPARYYHMAGYEPRVMSFYGPTIPDYFQDLILRIGDRLAP